MHLFVDISSHGLGHLAITAPVLNTIARLTPDFRLTIRSALPASKLQQRIKTPYTLIASATDFGYVMIDATRVDLAASATAYRQAHADWPARVADEARFLASLKPDLVLTNVSYLPILLKNSLIGEKVGLAEKLDVHNRSVFDDLISGKVLTYPGKTRF